MKYIKINLKPLSVNNAWQGKRFKTPEYNKFERDCLLMMPNMHIPVECCRSGGFIVQMPIKSTHVEQR